MGAWGYNSHTNDYYIMWKPQGGEKAILRKANSSKSRGQDIAGAISERPSRLRQLNAKARRKAAAYLSSAIRDAKPSKSNSVLGSEYGCLIKRQAQELKRIKSYSLKRTK